MSGLAPYIFPQQCVTPVDAKQDRRRWSGRLNVGTQDSLTETRLVRFMKLNILKSNQIYTFETISFIYYIHDYFKSAIPCLPLKLTPKLLNPLCPSPEFPFGQSPIFQSRHESLEDGLALGCVST